MKISKALPMLVAAGLALVVGIWTALRFHAAEPPPLQSGTQLREPRPLAPFALVDHEGKPFGNAELLGHWTLLFAGFTHCPDVCPTTLALMKQVQDRLAAQRRALRPLFLSVDPERDTPDRLRSYVGHFGSEITGITGEREQIDRLCASLGIAYVKVPGSGPDRYTMDHTAALVLIDPRGRTLAYFQAPHSLDTLAADLARVLPTT